MATTTTTMTKAQISTESRSGRFPTTTTTTTTTTYRPRRSSKSKHLNLWRDIDSPLLEFSSDNSSPPWPIDVLSKYLPSPVRTRLEKVSPQTYDLVVATFFSALAIVVLSIMFIGPRMGIITSIMGTYALGFGICVGAWEVMRLVDDRSGAREGIQNQTRLGGARQ